MPIFNEEVSKQLRNILQNMKDSVNMIFFTQKIECDTCKDTHSFIDELSKLSDKLSLTVFDFQEDKEKADFYKVDKIPAITLLDSKDRDTGIKFYGIPAGYEINSFTKSLMEISGIMEPLPDSIKSRLAKINKDIHIQVFVSLG